MSAEEMKKDPIIKSILDEGGLEHPSSKFTNNIINAIKAQSKDAAYVYKPVISKSAWLVLIFMGSALFIYLLLGLSPENSLLNLEGFSFSVDTSALKSFFGKFSLSLEMSPIYKTALIALSLFTFTNLIIFELRNKSLWK